MANLETLELTINANAESATKGIDKLIHSLSSLSDALTKPFSDLCDFNAELKKMKELSQSIKLPNVAKATGASAASARAKKNIPNISKDEPSPMPAWMQEAQRKNDEWKERLRLNPEDPNKTFYQNHPEALEEYKQQQAERNAQYAREVAERKARNEEMRKRFAARNNASEGSVQVDSVKTEIAETTESVKEYKESVSEANKTTEEMSKTTKSADKSVSNLKVGFKNLAKGIVAFFAIKKVMKSLIGSIKEGISNLYDWSKASNGTFAKAMDSAKAKVSQLKSSLGAALAPAITALIPLFNSLANVVIDAANYVNQFFALLTGQDTWTKATRGVDDYTDSANGAAKAAKEATASMDELNILSSSSSGGGNSSNEQIDAFQNVSEYDSSIRSLVTFVKENLSTISGLIATAGAALLAWKVSEAFDGMLSQLAGVLAIAGVAAVTIGLTWLFANEYLDTGEPGWLIFDALVGALGATAAGVMADQIWGGSAGYYAASIVLAFAAVTNIAAVLGDSDVSAFSVESVSTLIVGALEAGAAAGLIASTVEGVTTLGAVGVGAGVALAVFSVAIGIKAALDENVELFSAKNVIATVAASVATGLGSYLVLGTSIAGSSLIAIATFALLVALKVNSQKNKISWGDLELTKEQIDSYVKSNMFTAEASVLIDKINATLDEKATLEEDIRTKLSEINAELNVLTLGVDTEETLKNIAALIGGEDGTGGLVKDISDLCDVNIELLKLNFGNITAYDGEGNEISSDVLLSGIEGWNKVKAEMEANGKELTTLLYKGATEQLTPEEQAYAQELLEKVTGLARKIANAQEYASATVDFETAALAAMSKNSVQGIIDAFKTYSASNEATIRKGWVETAKSYLALAEMEDDPELKAKYKKAAEDIIAGLDKTVADELAQQNQPGVDLIKEWLLNNVKITSGAGSDFWVGELEKNGFTASQLSTALHQVFLNNNVDRVVIDAMNLIGFSGWDLLSEDLKKKFLSAVDFKKVDMSELKKAGIPVSDIINLTGYNKLTADVKKQVTTAMINAYGSSTAIADIKKSIPDISAQGIVDITDWDSLTDEERNAFVNAMKESFGEEDTKTALKNIGVDIGKEVDNGVNSTDHTVSVKPNLPSLESTNKTINETIKPDDEVVKVKTDAKNLTDTATAINNGISAGDETVKVVVDAMSITDANTTIDEGLVDPKLKATLTSSPKDAKSLGNMMKGWIKKGLGKPLVGIKADKKTIKPTYNEFNTALKGKIKEQKVGVKADPTSITGVKNEVDNAVTNNGNKRTFAASLSADSKTNIKNEAQTALDGVDLKAKATVTLSNASTLAGTFKDIFKKAFDFLGLGAFFAEGGFVETGSLFVAGEAGPEIVGTIGNRTAVANQDQIVEGIASGVAAANAEQNALLRRQNEILYALLQKNTSVQIGASSAMGRVVKQSLDMYSTLVGG